jgi:DNA-binding GntR family transcriptional regulator
MVRSQPSRVPLSEKAYLQIKEKIVSVVLRPGALVDEGALAEELSIGRTPIHEAIMRLYAEELLEAVPGRGYFVRSIGIDDIRMLFEAMMISERAAVVLAARRITSDQIDRLQRINVELKAAMDKKDSLTVTYLNGNLHRSIYEATQNTFLQSSLNQLQNQAQRLAYLCFSDQGTPGDLEEHYRKVDRDHDELIDFLESGNEPELVRVMTRHIQLFHQRISRYTSPAPVAMDLLLAPIAG